MPDSWEGIRSLTSNLWISQSRFFFTNAGIFISGKQACLIDPCMAPDEMAQIRRFLNEHDLSSEVIVLTHHHWDHILGPAFFPEAQVVAHTALPQQLTDKSGADTLAAIAQWEVENGFQGVTPFHVPKMDRLVNPPEPLVVGDLVLELIHTPGHSPDQIALYEPESATLWASDILSDVEIPFISHSLSAFEHTLARLAMLEIRTLVPGHGFPSQDATTIHQRFNQDRAYLAEMHDRVEAAIAAGLSLAETVERCANMAYRNQEENALPHRRNVESVYAELGGEADPTQVGWSLEYE
jgi:hydroxyacylglutathione hydrolase